MRFLNFATNNLSELIIYPLLNKEINEELIKPYNLTRQINLNNTSIIYYFKISK